MSKSTVAERAERIVIDMPNGTKLVAETIADLDYKELFVGLEDKDGTWIQDLVVVGEKYRYNRSGVKETIDNEYSVKVYSDEYSEDYTHEFSIREYKE